MKLTLQMAGLVVVVFFVTVLSVQAQHKTIYDKLALYANDHFVISDEDDHVKIKMDKGEWESFSIRLDQNKFLDESSVLSVRSEQDVTLRIEIFQGNEQRVLKNVALHGQEFNHVKLDIANMYDRSRTAFLIIYVNPGEIFSGTVELEKESRGAITEVAMYPNPASSDFFIALPANDYAAYDQISILDVSGFEKISQSVDADSPVQNINVSDLTKGIYFVRLQGKSKTTYSRISIQ